MATPDTKHSIVIKSEGDYRGGTRQWSNRYHFEGALPSSPAAWEAFADLIVAQQKTCFVAFLHIVEAVGYDAGSASSTNPHGNAVWVKSYSAAGTFSPAGTDNPAPGDCAALVRYTTPARTTRNHPVYLFNYYHNAYAETSDADALAADQKTLLEAYADHWVSGFLCEGSVRERCGPRGAVATGRRVDPYVRHRDFPS
jgi:hypothetical protein